MRAIAERRYSYWFMTRVRYAPETPGRIMAHRAMKPVTKSTGSEWPSPDCPRPPMRYPAARPRATHTVAMTASHCSMR
ncbi:MAG: hypothetical protein A4E39_00969 [Methanoregulaceae archaeon PtaB.Bin152]|nr:MAG: hypothetical protein A4E39_00969 [Methanoregulaceae archaeon PtaB.Bin152]